MKIRVSQKGYNQKPDTDDLKSIQWHFKNSNCIEVSYSKLKNYIEQGYSVLLADYQDNCNSVKEEFITSLECIALDIDSKENKITMYEMITLIHQKIGVYPVIEYCTFSDTDYTRFRLIYRLEDKVDVEVYKTLYKALQWKFNKYLDPNTSNANRVWAGTNKGVTYRENDRPFTFAIVLKLINSYNAKLKREERKRKVVLKGESSSFQDDGLSYIKPEYKELVMEYVISNINLKDFIQDKFGGRFRRNGNNWCGCCVLHGGDNKDALSISERIYTCYTNCGTGNIITVAKRYYNESNFSQVVFKLANDYNLNIPDEYIVNR